MAASNCGICSRCIVADYRNLSPFERAMLGCLCETVKPIMQRGLNLTATKYEKLEAILTNIDYLKNIKTTKQNLSRPSSILMNQSP